MPDAKILYLHGFRSSPDSFKARLMAQAMAGLGRQGDWACPALPASPRAAAILARETAQALLAGVPPRQLTVVGSSLGGYYATWLAEALDCKAVMINPAVNAPRDLATQVGEHTMYHSAAPFVFLPEYVQELRELHVPILTHPERYFLLAATGDEVLDWREMRERFEGCRQRIIPGSDHGVSDFAQWMPEVLDFALGHPH
ncbi:YqiA/YcfP family alpha/beta fold hydrolase [Bordetella hinzii]|uniref:YqiA/YcfP family alpha/beta fold hydrolase n=1 Tax=Bordetella hinzii TaxID=103855 RepID=UPI001163F411|nr:YqiA/YcfP family alpha/beta fold hydrolase [Bordetella hinzii]QDJ50776.1 esterase [Bordetella hinzii]